MHKLHVGPSEVRITSENGTKSATMEEAHQGDMPNGWQFDWQSFWESSVNDSTDVIIKFVYAGSILGLVRYTLYNTCYAEDKDGNIIESDTYNQVEILHLETHPSYRHGNPNRMVRPIGIWLVYYVCTVALSMCLSSTSELASESSDLAQPPLVVLSALEEAVDYYKNVIQMELRGTTSGGPGEDDLHVFTFSREAAIEFCDKHTRSVHSNWGADE